MTNEIDEINNILKDDFIMSPKLDFAFKLLFGDENNIELLRAFLSAVLRVQKENLVGIKIINTELYRWFKDDKKGILDVRVITKDKEQIDIEIQITPTDFMPERTLFYWSKMYSTQIGSGDTYDKLKKCITINIVDFKCINIKKLHTVYHLVEDETKYKLTDIIEVHFLELSKLNDEEVPKDESDPIVEWMEFLNAKSKEVMKMLAQKNKDIEKAVHILEVLSKDEKARMAYEAREAQIKDDMTRMKMARKEGENKKAREIAMNLLDVLDDETISIKTGLSIEEIKKLKQ